MADDEYMYSDEMIDIAEEWLEEEDLSCKNLLFGRLLRMFDDRCGYYCDLCADVYRLLKHNDCYDIIPASCIAFFHDTVMCVIDDGDLHEINDNSATQDWDNSHHQRKNFYAREIRDYAKKAFKKPPGWYRKCEYLKLIRLLNYYYHETEEKGAFFSELTMIYTMSGSENFPVSCNEWLERFIGYLATHNDIDDFKIDPPYNEWRNVGQLPHGIN